MADFSYEITDLIGILKESETHDWVKALTRISWNGGPANLDIRNLNLGQNRLGKGITITDEEAEMLTNLLLDQGFGSIESLQEAIKRKRCFSLEETTEEDKQIIQVGE